MLEVLIILLVIYFSLVIGSVKRFLDIGINGKFIFATPVVPIILIILNILVILKIIGSYRGLIRPRFVIMSITNAVRSFPLLSGIFIFCLRRFLYGIDLSIRQVIALSLSTYYEQLNAKLVIDIPQPLKIEMVPRVKLAAPNFQPLKASHSTVALNNMTPAFSNRAWLVETNGEGRIALDNLPLIFGRGVTIGSYRVTDAAVSAKHARIEIDNGQYIITDLGSTNKTFINDKSLEPHKGNPLNDGIVIRMGRTEFVFQE